jgi:hypothetical protein
MRYPSLTEARRHRCPASALARSETHRTHAQTLRLVAGETTLGLQVQSATSIIGFMTRRWGRKDDPEASPVFEPNKTYQAPPVEKTRGE